MSWTQPCLVPHPLSGTPSPVWNPTPWLESHLLSEAPSLVWKPTFCLEPHPLSGIPPMIPPLLSFLQCLHLHLGPCCPHLAPNCPYPWSGPWLHPSGTPVPLPPSLCPTTPSNWNLALLPLASPPSPAIWPFWPPLSLPHLAPYHHPLLMPPLCHLAFLPPHPYLALLPPPPTPSNTTKGPLHPKRKFEFFWVSNFSNVCFNLTLRGFNHTWHTPIHVKIRFFTSHGKIPKIVVKQPRFRQ